MGLIKKAKWAYICISAIMIILGIILVLFPKMSAYTLCTIFGIVLTAFGIIKLFGYFSKDIFRLAFQFDLALGIFVLIAGILLLAMPQSIIKTLPVIIGVFILIDGAFKAQTAIDAKLFGMEKWWLILVLAILTGICGLLLIINPFDGAIALMILIGATLIIDGAQNLCVVAYTVHTEKSNSDENKNS